MNDQRREWGPVTVRIKAVLYPEEDRSEGGLSVAALELSVSLCEQLITTSSSSTLRREINAK